MSKELPHASLQCSDCGTTFRVTLKKGRVPSRPIPCPKCKTPITVHEDDIVQPGERRTRIETRPGDVLRKTRLAAASRDGIAALMDDPPTAEVPTDDPPTAEVEIDSEDVRAAMEDSAPAFGIVQRRKIGAKSGPPEERKETPLGVDIAKPTGHGRRDNVFGDRTSSSVAIGRIATKQVQSLDKQLNPNDPDLPGTGAAEPEPEKPAKKLDLSRLRKVMAKLDTESDGQDEEFKNPLDDFDLDIDDNVDDLISTASDAIESELSLLSEPFEADAESAGEDEDEASIEEPAEVSEPQADEASEPAEPEAQPEPEPEPSEPEELPQTDTDEPLEVEPAEGMLNVEDSEAYELGAAEIPVRIPDAPRSRANLPGILVGIVVLIVFLAIFYVMAS